MTNFSRKKAHFKDIPACFGMSRGDMFHNIRCTPHNVGVTPRSRLLWVTQGSRVARKPQKLELTYLCRLATTPFMMSLQNDSCTHHPVHLDKMVEDGSTRAEIAANSKQIYSGRIPLFQYPSRGNIDTTIFSFLSSSLIYLN